MCGYPVWMLRTLKGPKGDQLVLFQESSHVYSMPSHSQKKKTPKKNRETVGQEMARRFQFDPPKTWPSLTPRALPLCRSAPGSQVTGPSAWRRCLLKRRGGNFGFSQFSGAGLPQQLTWGLAAKRPTKQEEMLSSCRGLGTMSAGGRVVHHHFWRDTHTHTDPINRGVQYSGVNVMGTLPSTDIAPVGGYLEDDVPLEWTLCQVPC